MNQQKKNIDTPLHIAIKKNNAEIVSLLLKRRKNSCNILGENGMTPLMFAVKKDNVDSVKLLLENKADLTLKNDINRTALHYATSINTAKLLLENKADPNTLDCNGMTPLICTINNPHNNGDGELFEYLAKKTDPNIQENRGKQTALHMAFDIHDNNLAKLLIKNKADFTLKDCKGQTALHYAVNNDYEATKLLLERKANINEKDNNGITPLHLAVKRNNNKMVELLLENEE